MYTNHPLNVEVHVPQELSMIGSDEVYFVLLHKNSLVMKVVRRDGQYVQMNASVLDAGCRVCVVCGQLSAFIESPQSRSQVQYIKFDSEQFEQNLFNQIDNFSFKQEVVVLCDSEENTATLKVNKHTGAVELVGNMQSTIDAL